MQFMENIVSAHPALACRTGVPGPYQLIVAYLNILMSPESSQVQSEDGTVEGKPLWAVLFYGMRCGSLLEVLEGVGDTLAQVAEWKGYLQEFALDGQLTPSMESQLRGNYRFVHSITMDY